MADLSPLDRALGWIPRRCGRVLVFVTILTALAAAGVIDFGSGRLRLEVDPSTDRLLPDDDASRRFFDRIRGIFGSDETLIVAYAGEEVFSTETLERVARMTARIEGLEGVDRVLSITNAVSVRGTDDGVDIAPLVTSIPSGRDELAALRREMLDDPIYGGSLVSRDARVTALLVYFMDMSNREFLDRDLDGQIVRIADEERGRGEVWITGGPHIRAETARILLGETFSLSFGILVALAGVLALCFRTFRGVVLPLLTIVVALTWTLAIIVWLGHELNAVTFLVPPLLTALGLSYSVHVVAEVAETGPGEDSAEDRDAATRVAQVARATRRVALPVGLTGLTTAAGFASLTLSPLAAVREFGLLSVIGVSCTMIASLTFTPAALALLPGPHRRSERPVKRGGISFERVAERLARFDIAHRKLLFAAFAVIFGVALLGASQLRIGTQQIDKFHPYAPVRLHFEAVNEHLDGANPLYVVVESAVPDAFKEPANLRALEELQSWLRDQPEIGATVSLVDYVKLINRGFHESDPAYWTIPESRRMVSQLLFFGGSEELDRFVDSRYQMASLHVRARVIDSDEVSALALRIEARLAELPPHLRGSVTGTSVVLTRTLDAIMRSQALSVVAALGIIYVILTAMFVSFRIGAIALLPNVLPVAAFFGALGILGISLDPGISLVAPLVLGIAVDDTIHYFSRFIREVRSNADEERSTVVALKAVGRPVTYTSLALVLGFLVLTTSELRSQVELGAMAAFSLGFAWLTDFTLTPALCTRLRIATLWDFLRVDLGPEAHRAISLLRDLRPSQARIVALMSSVVEVRRGERLFSEGEPGEAVYAVLEGELTSSTAHGGGRIQLSRHGRGDALGEIGILHLARSVDVDAVTDARLLRLTQDSIDQLARRYPRIATVVYRNLSGVAADRLVRATAGLRSAAEDRSPIETAASRPDSRRPRPALVARGRALADAFFGVEGERDRVALRRLEASDMSREAAARAGEADPKVAGILAGLGISLETLAALAVLPLVEVAWADGRLEPSERDAVLAAARSTGIPGDSPALHLLEIWLDRRPSEVLERGWREMMAAVCAELSVESRMSLRGAVLGSARRVAESAGGFLGVGSVSRREERVLSELERAITPEGVDDNS